MINSGLLARIVAPVFDKKLEALERNANAHLSLISASLELTAGVVKSCANIGMKVRETIERKRAVPCVNGMSANRRVNGSKASLNKSQAKTPTREKLTSSRSVNKYITPFNGGMNKCESIGSLLNKSKLKDKAPVRSNTVKVLPSLKRNGNGHPSTRNLKTVGNNNTSKRPLLLLEPTNNAMKLNKPTTSAKAKNLKLYNGKEGSMPVNRTTGNESFDKIFSLDEALLYNKEDPLLISPFTDKILFEDNDQLEEYADSLKFKVKAFKVEDWCEDHLATMLRYLTKTDIFRLLLVNKSFAHLLNQYLLSFLEEERRKYQSIVASIEKPPSSEGSPFNTPIQFSKKTFKAMSLLNESVINKLFTETKVPSNDILLIYAIYFQLINHQLASEVHLKKIFWKKCCQYFLLQSEGMTGDLLQKTMTNNLLMTFENMYRIMQLVEGNLNKLTPSYFSKICGTTGLVVFFIQDALEHLGISTDKAKRANGFLVYSGIVDVLGQKIDQFKHYAA